MKKNEFDLAKLIKTEIKQFNFRKIELTRVCFSFSKDKIKLSFIFSLYLTIQTVIKNFNH